MKVNEGDFQKKLDEIGKLYEDGKDAIHLLTYKNNLTTSDDISKQNSAMYSLRMLRDIAAMAVKSAYQVKDN